MLEDALQFLLKLPHSRVLRVEQSNVDYRFTLESTLDHAICRKCGRTITSFHGYADWITLQHLPISGQQVFIRLRPKRLRCPVCSDRPTTTQELPG
jgi:transposase